MFPYPAESQASPWGGSQACARASEAQNAPRAAATARAGARQARNFMDIPLAERRTVRRDSLAAVLHRLVDDGQQVGRFLRWPDEAIRFLLGRGDLFRR